MGTAKSPVKRRAAEDAQIDLGDAVIGHADGGRHAPRRVEFDDVPLAVGERKRVQLVALAAGNREHRGRIEAAAQQNHRFFQLILHECARTIDRS